MDQVFILNRLAELYLYKMQEDCANRNADMEDISYTSESLCHGFEECLQLFVDQPVFAELQTKAEHLAYASLNTWERRYFDRQDYENLASECKLAYEPKNRFAPSYNEEQWDRWAAADGVRPEPEGLLRASYIDWGELLDAEGYTAMQAAFDSCVTAE